jgi:hypothetical protein
MKPILAGVVVAVLMGAARPVGAQPVFGYTAFSINSDLNDQVFSGASGGVLIDVAHSWVSAGAEADLFVSWPYFAGRGGTFAQVNVVRRSPFRIFAMGGFSWGEQSGPMVGAGVELWTRGRLGLRATVQDYLARVEGFGCGTFGLDQPYCDANFHGGRAYTAHQPTVRIGIIWR